MLPTSCLVMVVLPPPLRTFLRSCENYADEIAKRNSSRHTTPYPQLSLPSASTVVFCLFLYFTLLYFYFYFYLSFCAFPPFSIIAHIN